MKKDTVSILICFAFLAVLGWVVRVIVIGYPQNPYKFDFAQSEIGLPLYQEHCEACHGPKAAGGTAPALNYDGVFRYGSSDWEQFQNIRQGITATDMAAFHDLSDDEIWQILGYINNADYILTEEELAAQEAEAAAAEAAGDGEPQPIQIGVSQIDSETEAEPEPVQIGVPQQ